MENLDFQRGKGENARMATLPPFRCDAVDDPDIALEIERDAVACGGAASITRYLDAVPALPSLPIALDTAIECALRAIGGDPLAAAQRLVAEHEDLADAILACALGLGAEHGAAPSLSEGTLIFGRWRVVEMLGSGATASVARVRDEALSTPDAPVDAIIKRFDESLGSEARAHALREMRALVAAPEGVAPRPLALHAGDGGACVLITRHETSRAARSNDDFAHALDAVDALHRSGMAHGDLKPDHLRVRRDGTVFLVDFGCACAADPASVRADLSRLAAMSRAASTAWIDRAAARVACNAAARGSTTLARAALRSASLGQRKRLAVRGLAATLASGVLVAAGLSFGYWLTAPPRIATAPYSVVDALAKTGRLREARIGPDGKISGVLLFLPELRQAPGVEDRDGRIVLSSLRFTPDGGIVATPSAKFGNPVSQGGVPDQ